MKVSVVIAVYNGEAFLRQQLDSLQQQSRAIDEFIIIDDQSSDSSIHILTEYIFPNLQLVLHKENVGPIKTFEEGIKIATGDIIFLCDQDDIWEKNKVEIFISEFESSGAMLCFSDAMLIDRKNNSLGQSFIERINRNLPKIISAKKITYTKLLSKQNIIAGAQMAFRKEIKTMDLFPFPTSEKHLLHDRYISLFVAASEKGSIHFIPKQLSKYRIHDKQYVGFNETKIVEPSRAEYFEEERRLQALISKKIAHPDYYTCHHFWEVRSKLNKENLFQKIIKITSLYLAGSYHKYCDRPTLEALADIKL